MVKRGSSTFSAASVAKGSMVLSRTVEKNFALEAEISRLRHHVSVLSQRLHFADKELARLRSADNQPGSPSNFAGDDVAPLASEKVAVVRVPLPSVASSEITKVAEVDNVAVAVAASSREPEPGTAEPMVTFGETRIPLDLDKEVPHPGPGRAIFKVDPNEGAKRGEEEEEETEEEGEEEEEPHLCPIRRVAPGVNGVVCRCLCGVRFVFRGLRVHLESCERRNEFKGSGTIYRGWGHDWEVGDQCDCCPLGE